jgi:hypothetical protein
MVRKFMPLCLLTLLCAALSLPAAAQSASYVTGVVRSQGQPVAGAAVTLSGNNLSFHTLSDPDGRFSFNAVPVGLYRIAAQKDRFAADVAVEVSSAGAQLTVELSELKEIASARTSARPNVLGAGTSLSIGGASLQYAPDSKSFSNILAQLPSAARGSNGQVHINGDHADINYIVDGVSVPQALSRVLGTEFDPTNVGYAEIIEGAFPAQYGERFAAVINIATRTGTGPGGVSVQFTQGTQNKSESDLLYQARLGAGGLTFSSRVQRDGWALDPPVPDPVHDAGSVATQFLRLSLPVHGYDNLNFDFNHTYQTFQIPPDTANGQPAATDDNETQDDTFLALVYHHAIGSNGILSFGPSFKRSHIRDFNDVANDLASAVGNDCGTNPGDCVFSAADDRVSSSYGFSGDYDLRSLHHEVRAGASYRNDNVSKLYTITLQADNFIQPDPLLIVDNAPNIAHTQSAYIQDTWKMGDRWLLDYGLREDSLQLSSTDFRVGFSQLSPRVKLTRTFGTRAGAYIYYGRLFIPFSFENISGGNAQFLNPDSGASFDLKPQRDSLYEAGGHLPVGPYDLGIRIAHYAIQDDIDTGQVGATNIHQDINFAQGATDIESLLLQRPLASGGREYVSVTRSRAVSRGCGSSLLVDCSQFPDDWSQADHDQRWDANTGVVSVSANGYFSAEAEYGSGLSSGECDTCKVPPHLTVDLGYGLNAGHNAQLGLTIRNALNDRYAVTLGNALQGTHFARPRSIELQLTLGPNGRP